MMRIKVLKDKINRSISNYDGDLIHYLWDLLVSSGVTNFIPDRTYIKIFYKMRTGKRLNLRSPYSFNEKIQWLKLYNRNPELSKMVDKFEAKKYVSELIGDEYIIPTIGIYDSFDEIPFDTLPHSFVIKCTHDSGGIVIVKEKERLNIEKAKQQIDKCLKRNFYYPGREWAYKNVKPRIIIEKYMEDTSGENGEDGLFDYKLFCFDGVTKIIQVDFNRFIGHKRNLYDTDWNYIDAEIEYPTDSNYVIKKPEVFEDMLRLAYILAKGLPFARVDFYCIHNRIYFGELTLYHGNGIEKFKPESFGNELGSYINLPNKKRRTK